MTTPTEAARAPSERAMSTARLYFADPFLESPCADHRSGVNTKCPTCLAHLLDAFASRPDGDLIERSAADLIAAARAWAEAEDCRDRTADALLDAVHEHREASRGAQPGQEASDDRRGDKDSQQAGGARSVGHEACADERDSVPPRSGAAKTVGSTTHESGTDKTGAVLDNRSPDNAAPMSEPVSPSLTPAADAREARCETHGAPFVCHDERLNQHFECGCVVHFDEPKPAAPSQPAKCDAPEAKGAGTVEERTAVDIAIADVEFANRRLGGEATRARLEEADRQAKYLRAAVAAALERCARTTFELIDRRFVMPPLSKEDRDEIVRRAVAKGGGGS